MHKHPSITHPDKILYPETKTTKDDLVDYYRKIFDLIKYELKDRAISMVRSPNGVHNFQFYQKHPGENFPDYIDRVRIHEKEGPDTYITIDEIDDIVYLVNLGVLEFHTWGSKVNRLEIPDKIVFDLDPDPEASWKQVINGAHEIKKILEDQGYDVFVKTSGKKGLHLIVPAIKRMRWEIAKEFAERIAIQLSESFPSDFTAALPKKQRKGKVFIDYLRNDRGSTAVAAFSTRIFHRPTISCPVKWKDVTEKLKPDQFDIENVFEEDMEFFMKWVKEVN